MAGAPTKTTANAKTPRAFSARGVPSSAIRTCGAYACRYEVLRLRNLFLVESGANRRRNDRARFLPRGPDRLWLLVSFWRFWKVILAINISLIWIQAIGACESRLRLGGESARR